MMSPPSPSSVNRAAFKFGSSRDNDETSRVITNGCITNYIGERGGS